MKLLIFAALFIPVIPCKSGIYTNQEGTLDSFSVQKIQDSTNIAGNWYLLPAMASDTAAGKIPQINFDLKTNNFSGNTGCNAMSGTFVIKQDAFQFNENIISTKMACPGYNEKLFIDNLLKTNRYQVKNGVLQLMYNATVLSQWARRIDTTTTKQI